MKFFTIFITNNSIQQHGRTARRTCRPIVLLFLLADPTTYQGNSFTWTQGRKLASGSMNGNTFSYYYDGDGLRHYKKVNGNRTFYYYKDGRIIAQFGLDTNERIFYFYDSMGIAGMSYKVGGSEQNYYFIKNTLGDVLAIQNESGTVVAWYEYDAWGNIVYQYGEMSYKNPFRYRGYYYDIETGFYYLQTRYYDPTTCRFINADNPELITTLAGVAGQLNLYAYCNNNPVMHTDETGEFTLDWKAALFVIAAGALLGAIMNGIKSYDEGNRGQDVVLDIVIGAAGGAALGGAVSMFSGIVGIIIRAGMKLKIVGSTVASWTYIGAAGFNFGSFVSGAFSGIKAPEPIEMPTQPQPNYFYIPITGF